ncbi:MAG TPA: ribosome small subunit-dependent GTPase A [Saprospiraceae bacterium]|nr:ribosome small subunit-dependent GTPase A [Saprospiraceae bacterium]
MRRGIVVKSTGSWYNVKLENGEVLACRIRGKFKLGELKLTNPVAVGDVVDIEMESDLNGMIVQILPRRNYVVRQSPRKKHDVHLLASNIDQALLIATIVQPNLKQGFIDRFLLMTEPYNIPVHIAFNKSDVYGEEERAMYKYIKEVYENIGYRVFLVSALDKTGIEELKMLLKDRYTLLSGQSGVGKSTLINAIDPSFSLKTGELSEYSGKGQHTTTFAEMFHLQLGGAIIDTPGIKTLSFNHLEVLDIAHNFREFFAASGQCKFSNCTHRNEPGCAVKRLVESGQISELRYINYVTILEEVEDQNYWERHRDI